MKKHMVMAAVVAASMAGAALAECVTLENDAFRLTLGEDASAKSLVVKATGEECLPAAANVPMFAVTQERPFNNEIKLIHMNKRTTYPACSLRLAEKCRPLPSTNCQLIVSFRLAPYEARVEVDVKPRYMAFRLVDFVVKPEDYGNLKMDVPPAASFRVVQLPVARRRNFGDWINATWDDKCAVGVLGTAVETFVDNEERQGHMLLAADLQRGCRLRGGSAALVAAATPGGFLDAVGDVEDDFGLPHGVRNRQSPLVNASMLRVEDLNPKTVDRYIAVAREAGVRLMLLYYTCVVKEVPSWGLNGNWDMTDAYPNGLADLKLMLGKLKAAGITPGLHFLHSHVGMLSRYVTPVADHRLNLTRRFTLSRPVEDGDTELFVEETPLDAPMFPACRVLKFGGELISYESYTTERPYRFCGIRRGAWSTRLESHAKGQCGGILDISEFWMPRSCYVDERTSLQDEIADKIAAVYGTGFEFAYFDGSEGVNPPFSYNVPYAQLRVWKKLSPEPVFAEAAAKAHFSWHMLAGANAFDIFAPEEFKQKIVEFPLAEAPLMRSNFTRLNFGWWQLYLPGAEGKGGKPTIGTQPDMWEFGASRAAAWDCPTTINFQFNMAQRHPRLHDLLEVVRRWEDVRARKWLTATQKEALKSPTQEHHLIVNGKGEYELVEVEELPGVAGGRVRAFMFERGGMRYVTLWHASGECRLSLPTGFAFTLHASPDGDALPVRDGGFKLSSRVYLRTAASAKDVRTAFSKATEEAE
ncbi:MAG: hypothetical protein IKE55_06240 [Kiritimatiellae bacterium]|nr:hypothetical protein [Kiritimatiellia bacterium]